MDFAKKIFSIFTMNLGASGLTFFLRLALAALLGPYNYGLFALILLIPEYSEKLGRFGIDDAAVYWAGKKKYSVADVAVNVGVATVVLSFIPILLFLWQGELFSSLLLKNYVIDANLIMIVLLMIPFIFLVRSVSKLLLLTEEITKYNLITFLPPLFGLLLGVTGILLFKGGLFVVFLGFTISYVCAGIVGAIIIIKFSSGKLTLRFVVIKDLFAYGLKMYLPNVIQYLQYRSDMLLVAYFLTPIEVGYYALAVNLVEILRKIPTTTASLLFPRAARLSASEAVALTAKTCRNVFFIILVLFIPFYFAVRFIVIPIVGDAYIPILSPFLILIPSMFGVCILHLLMIYFYGRGKPTIVLRSVVLGLLLNVILNLILIPRLGISGAALASVISYIACAVLLALAFVRINKGVSYRDLIVLDKKDLVFYLKLLYLG